VLQANIHLPRELLLLPHVRIVAVVHILIKRHLVALLVLPASSWPLLVPLPILARVFARLEQEATPEPPPKVLQLASVALVRRENTLSMLVQVGGVFPALRVSSLPLLVPLQILARVFARLEQEATPEPPP